MSAAVPDGPSCAKRAEPPMTTMSPPPLDGLGSIFLAGESKESVCEFGMTVSVATDVEAAAAFERKLEKKLAEAKTGTSNAKDAPPRRKPTKNTFFAFPEKDGSAVGVGFVLKLEISLCVPHSVIFLISGSTGPLIFFIGLYSVTI